MMERSAGSLPDVIVIGAMRAGTTTLYEYLAAHPQVGVSALKETDFFLGGRHWQQGLDWYRRQFSPGFQRYAEVSPNYTKVRDFPGVPERAAATLPECRFIYMVRDPVGRAVSQYAHGWLAGHISLRPEELHPDSHDWQHLLDASRYAVQLEAWLAHVPPERILVLEFEAFVADPAASLSEIARFIGVDDTWPAPDSAAANGTEVLARTPGFVFRLREHPLVEAAKGVLPRGVVNRLRGAMAFGGERQVPPLGPELRARMAEALAADAARFRALTGLRPSTWSV